MKITVELTVAKVGAQQAFSNPHPHLVAEELLDVLLNEDEPFSFSVTRPDNLVLTFEITDADLKSVEA